MLLLRLYWKKIQSPPSRTKHPTTLPRKKKHPTKQQKEKRQRKEEGETVVSWEAFAEDKEFGDFCELTAGPTKGKRGFYLRMGTEYCLLSSCHCSHGRHGSWMRPYGADPFNMSESCASINKWAGYGLETC